MVIGELQEGIPIDGRFEKVAEALLIRGLRMRATSGAKNIPFPMEWSRGRGAVQR